jgi:hypothetical protein|tara:strand:+ start:184 stop:399 length:216 start_codon:yes stop_codon:yes gene_type:complete
LKDFINLKIISVRPIIKINNPAIDKVSTNDTTPQKGDVRTMNPNISVSRPPREVLLFVTIFAIILSSDFSL